MLATMADIVFLLDNSTSDNFVTISWLKGLVTGDTNNDGVPDVPNLSVRLAAHGVTDVRYGVVAFGEVYANNNVERFAHSEVVDRDAAKPVFERLFSNGPTATDHIADLEATLDHVEVEQRGGVEDGWDAIDHAIAEYDFRPGAVPVFVLIQNEEGRVAGPPQPDHSTDGTNFALTHDGILAAMKSKNVILDSIVQGESNGALFDLGQYESNAGDFANIRILGVDAAISGNGQHEYHAFDTATNTVPTALPPSTADALQISFNGSNTGATGMVASGKSILFGKNISTV